MKTPRTSKKALAIAEQAERAAYAQSLFDDLNQSVFGGGLPATTTLVWSNRLLTTAGRARWHRWVMVPFVALIVVNLYLRRSKEGVHTTSIELATKILDSNGKLFFEPFQRLAMILISCTFEERIRNTLSHEMCHLACWFINKEPKEVHGKIWKSWCVNVLLLECTMHVWKTQRKLHRHHAGP